MAKYAAGGNVHDGAADHARLRMLLIQQLAVTRKTGSRRDQVMDFFTAWSMPVILPVAVVASVAGVVFLFLTAVAAQAVYGLRVTATAAGFHGVVTKTYNWPGVGDVFGYLCLGFVVLALVAWVVFIFAVTGEVTAVFLTLFIAVLVGVGLLGVAGGVVSINHGEVDAAGRMQDRMNNWLVDTLHVPGEINILDETTFTRDYLRYDPEHRAVYFTIRSTADTVTVIPRR